ncbi:MAG: hypothetical protein ACOZE5_09860 [Verrucomicrobiota bacterium]
MNTKLLIGLVAVVLSSSVPSLDAQTQKEEMPIVNHPLAKIEITAAKVNERNDGKLSFVVKNGSSSTVKVVQDYLPWNTTSALKLLAVPLAKGAAPVEPVQPFEDPRATVQEIAGNAELRGELDVARFFPRWKELVKQGVLLVWSLNLYDVETGQDRRFNGVIEYRAK